MTIQSDAMDAHVLAPSGVAFGGPVQTDRKFYQEFEIVAKQRTKAELKQQVYKLTISCWS